ncbi:MAG: beta-propeller fold lactonase family protein, partial [Gemmatimonadales bacterium]
MKNVRWAAGALLALGACTGRDLSGPASPELRNPELRANASVANAAQGVVYTMSNAVAGNSVLSFNSAADGSLSAGPVYPTGGAGSGGGLSSQGALILAANGRYLIAVNAGSNDISVFAVTAGGLRFVGVTASGGVRPVSVTERRGIAYVLNGGGTNNITGFTFDGDGNLALIP